MIIQRFVPHFIFLLLLLSCQVEKFRVTSGSASAGICSGAASLISNGFHAGSGSALDPFIICDISEFTNFSTQINLSNLLDKNFKLGQSINFAGAAIIPLDTFDGVFDGNNKTLSNFIYNGSADNMVGVFRTISALAVVKNLTLSGYTITGGTYSGALVGVNEGTITNSHANGTLTRTFVTTDGVQWHNTLGGLVGINKNIITQSSTSGAVIGNLNSFINEPSGGEIVVGGLVGENRITGVITKSHSTSTVSSAEIAGGSWGSGAHVGGLVGANTNFEMMETGGSIATSYATGSVSTTGYGATVLFDWDVAGGLVGKSFGGTIVDSFSSGAVSSSSADTGTGGLIGDSKTTVERCYSSSPVTVLGAGSQGGLAGFLGVDIDYSFWNIDLGQANCAQNGGLICSGASDATDSVGLNTATMKTSAPYLAAGWSTAVWLFTPGQYPQLR